MSSVLYGLEQPPLALSVLREWMNFGGDEFSLYHRLRSGSQGQAWQSLWEGLPTEEESGAKRAENRLEDIVRVYGLPVMRRHLGIVGLREWSCAGLPTYRLSSEQYVALGISAGIVGEVLAEQSGQDVIRGFLVGLFSALGLVPMANLLVRVKPNATYPERVAGLSARIRWERDQTQQDSLSVGGDLLDLWGFPASISAAVRGLAYPLLVARGRPLAMIGHLSARMAPAVAFGDASALIDRVSIKCFESFGIAQAAIPELVEEANRRVSDVLACDWPETFVSFSRGSGMGLRELIS